MILSLTAWAWWLTLKLIYFTNAYFGLDKTETL